MKAKIIKSLLLFFGVCIMGVNKTKGQIGIGTINPNSSAMLDINTNSRGLLIPRMTATQRQLINVPATGLVVYQIDGETGFYYNSGTPGLPEWGRLLSSLSGSGWSLTGNSGTNPAVNFIGTIDAQPLIFKLNNIIAGMIDSAKGATHLGYQTGYTLTSGTNNTLLGYQSGKNITTGSGNIFIGYQTGLNYHSSQSGNIFIGNSAGYSATTGFDNNFIGHGAGQNNTSGYTNNFFGESAGRLNSTGNSNTFLGAQAGYSNTIANSNTFVGYTAGHSNDIGNENTFLGKYSGYTNNAGSNNTATGANALFNNTTGANNVANGFQALYSNVSGGNNTAVGWKALYSSNVGLNTGVGSQALMNTSTGDVNTGIGTGSLMTNISGSYNTGLGYSSNVGLSNLTNTTALGYGALVNSSNTIVLGNSTVSSIGGFVNWSNISDSRFKTDINDNVPGLAFITRLKAVTYRLDLHKINRFFYGDSSMNFEIAMTKGIQEKEKIIYSGFLAQQVEDVARLVGYNFSGVIPPQNEKSSYSISYADFVVPLVKAVQELAIENNLLKTNQLKQESDIETLKNEILLLKNIK